MLTEMLRRTVKLHGPLTLVRDDRRSITAAALDVEVETLAGRLAGLGVVTGDRVGILSRNRVEVVAACFATARLGAALVPINWRLRTEEIRHIVEDSRATVVLIEPSLVAEVRPLVEAADRCWVSLDDALEGVRALADLSPARLPPVPTDDRAVAVQMYTSGTTGRPKGAMLTNANLWAAVSAYHLEFGLEPERSVFLQVTPLFHVGGLLMMLLCLSCPCTMVLHAEFAPTRVVASLEGDGITHTLLVPAMIRWVSMEPGVSGRRFPTLRVCGYGAAPMPPELFATARTLLGCDFLQGYGLTETCGVVTALRPVDHRDGTDAVRMSAGREIHGCEIRVVGPDDRELPRGQAGEIVVRGPNITPGYAGQEDATAEALRGGWFHTGDVGTMDERGYVTVVDRLKDMILVGGENVYPSEVEAVLRTHPHVREVAVVGVPHAVWGEEVLAVVVPTEGAPTDDGRLLRDLVRHARATLATFKCPTKVVRAAELPRNAAGKVLKQELRSPWWEGRVRRV